MFRMVRMVKNMGCFFCFFRSFGVLIWFYILVISSDSNGRFFFFFFGSFGFYMVLYIWFDRDNTGILMGNGGSSHFFNGSSNGFRHYFKGSQLAYLLGL